MTVLIGSVSSSIHAYRSSLVDHSLVFIFIGSSDWSCLMLLIGSATPSSNIEALSVLTGKLRLELSYIIAN